MIRLDEGIPPTPGSPGWYRYYYIWLWPEIFFYLEDVEKHTYIPR